MRASLALRSLVRFACLLLAGSLVADEVTVRHREGRIHGFLVLEDLNGHFLASGTSVQYGQRNLVISELSFRFKDGSVFQETAAYSQNRTFRLRTYHLVQKGPAFKDAVDLSLNTSTGQVRIRYTDHDGKRNTIDERRELPTDLANGMVPTLLADIGPTAAKTTLSMLVATPKPRLVKLEISPAGEDSFTVGGSPEKATRYVVKVDLGGIVGVVAPIVGKQPPDVHVWMIRGKAPGFLKSEGPLFEDGPIWRIALASPVWPKVKSNPK
jgi:hypothetical protein